MNPILSIHFQGFIQDFSTGGGGGGPASVPLCSHPRYTRSAGGGGGLCQYWLDWTSGERQACVTIHGCKIAYVHIQLAFEISVPLKISGGDDPPDPEWGGHPPPSQSPPWKKPWFPWCNPNLTIDQHKVTKANTRMVQWSLWCEWSTYSMYPTYL